MKTDFYEAHIGHFPRLPAEACSELGYASERRKRALWVSRWLEVTRRWFSRGRGG
ncbi:MAG: hypothetical protein AABZ67_16755 [Pseudomonadota bacterium]